MKIRATLTLSLSLILSLPVQANSSWKVIGRDDFVPVGTRAFNIPSALRPVVDAMGMISMGCTATHIGANLVLTAGHCFNAPEFVVENTPCSDITVTWGFRGSSDGFMVSQCKRILAMQMTDGLDWAILQVDRAPRTFVKIDPRPLRLGTALTIFSHPEMRSLRWSKTCRFVRPPNFPFGTKSMYHRCDTNPGSSGATILDAQSLAVVAIHDGGDMQVNYGTFLSAIPLQQILIKNRIFLPGSRQF